jgi:tetratricopeptide (TPR) repeat protein
MQNSEAWRNPAMYCVIVGDIVNSREIDPATREKVTLTVRNLFDRINAEYIDSLMTTFGMVRGDAFEGVLLSQYYAPFIVQDIIKTLYQAEKTVARISVVIGQLTVTGDDRNITDGPAFHQALDDLAELKARKSAHWLQVSFRIGDLAQKLVDGHLALLMALTADWTEKQRAIAWSMEACNYSVKLVSKKEGISPSVITKQLKASNFTAYRMAWDGLTDYLGKMDEYVTEDKPVSEKSYLPYYSLALRKYNQYDYESALALLKKALELAKADVQEDNTLLIPIYNFLSDTYCHLDKYDESKEMIQKSLQLQESLPKARMQYLQTLLIEAVLYVFSMQYELAEEKYKNAIDLAHSTLGEANYFFMVLYNRFALLFMYKREYEKALKYYNNALEIGKKYLDEEPTEYAIVLLNLAECYYEMQSFSRAMSFAEEALSIFSENLPSEHKYIDKAKDLITEIKAKEE